MKNEYFPGQTIYFRGDGAKIVLDSVSGEGINIEVYGHVVDESGKEYPSKLLENITKFGYWEWVGDQESDDSSNQNTPHP